MAGFIKLSRDIANWRWYKEQNTLCIFLHLILKANQEDSMSGDIFVPKGSLVTSRKLLSAELGISERSVRTALERLSNDQQIAIQTTNKESKITICNYDSYIDLSETNDQQSVRPTTNELQKIKEEKERDLFESPRKNKEENKEERKEDKPSTKKYDIAWRKDRNVYTSLVDEAERELIIDYHSKEEFKRIFPNGDYEKTIMRTADFWRTDKGYEYKLKGRSRTLNMKSTIKNNWDKNVIYVGQQQQQPQQGEKKNNIKPNVVIIDGEEWQI